MLCYFNMLSRNALRLSLCRFLLLLRLGEGRVFYSVTNSTSVVSWRTLPSFNYLCPLFYTVCLRLCAFALFLETAFRRREATWVNTCSRE